MIHPAAIGAIDDERQNLAVQLTKARIKDSPGILHDQPVSRQMEAGLCGYYGWNLQWGGSFYGMGAIAAPFSSAPYFGGFGMGETVELPSRHEDQELHLHGAAEMDGYHIHAADSAIGHAQDLLVEEHGWGIRDLVFDTRDWWAGQHVLVSPYAVREIRWGNASPPWHAPLEQVDESYERELHAHYGWPGYGW